MMAIKFRAGYYRFSGEYPLSNIVDRLHFGIDQSYRVTFLEGETIADLANTLEKGGPAVKE